MVTEINEEQVSQHIGQGVQFLESVGSAGGEADEGGRPATFPSKGEGPWLCRGQASSGHHSSGRV
jgi:hypothetical protein